MIIFACKEKFLAVSPTDNCLCPAILPSEISCIPKCYFKYYADPRSSLLKEMKDCIRLIDEMLVYKISI